MPTGDITATAHGTYSVSSAALLTQLNTMNCGGAVAGLETATIWLLPAEYGQVTIIKLARAA